MTNKEILNNILVDSKEEAIRTADFNLRRDIENEIDKKNIRDKLDAESQGQPKQVNTELPIESKLSILEQKEQIAKQQRLLRDKTYQSIADQDITNQKNIRLQEQQAQETLNAQMRKDYDLATTSTKHSLVDFMDKDFEYGWKQNVDIPLATKHALERNALNTQEKYRAFNNQLAITNKFFEDEFNSLEETYKAAVLASQDAYKPFGEFIQDETFQIYQRAVSLAANDMAEATQTFTTLDNLIRGGIHAGDSVINLGGAATSLITSLFNLGTGKGWEFKARDAKLLERLFGYAFDYKSMNARDLISQSYDFIDKLSAGYVFETFLESLPEMLLVYGGTSKVEEAIKIATKAGSTALKEGMLAGKLSNTVKRKIEKEIAALTAAGDIKLAQTYRHFLVNIDKLFKGTKGRYVGMTKQEFANLAGNLSSKFITKRAVAKEALRFKNFPYLYLGADVSRRIVDLANESPSKEINFSHIVSGMIHTAVDWAGIFAMTGSVGRIRNLPAFQSKLTKTGEISSDIIGGMAIEGVGEQIQTYLELQAQNDQNLPSLHSLIINDNMYRREAQQINLAGALGALTGGALTGITTVGGELLSSGLQKAKEETANFFEQESIAPEAPSQLDDELLKKYQEDVDRELNRFNAKDNPETGQSAEDFTKAQSENFETLKESAQDIKTAEANMANEEKKEGEKETKEQDISVKTNNNVRIEQLENEIAGLQEELEVAQSEEEKAIINRKIDNRLNLIDKYKLLDEIQKNQQLSTALLRNIEGGDKAKVKEQMDALTKLAKARTPEERAEAIQEFIDALPMGKNRANIIKAIENFLGEKDSVSSKRNYGYSGTDKAEEDIYGKNNTNNNNNKKDTSARANPDDNTYDSDSNDSNQNNPKQQNNTNNTQGNTNNTQDNTQNNNTQDNTQDNTTDDTQTEEQDKQESPKQKTFEEEIEEVKNKDEQALKAFLKTLDAQAAAYILLTAADMQRNPQGKASTRYKPNKAFEEFKAANALIYIPISDLDREADEAVNTRANERESILHTRQKEVIVVPRYYINRQNGTIEYIQTNTDRLGDIQSAIRTLADVKRTAFQNKIKNLQQSLQNGELTDTEIQKKAQTLEDEWTKMLNDIQNHSQVLNWVIMTTNNKKVISSLKGVLYQTRMEVEKIDKDLRKLCNIFKNNPTVLKNMKKSPNELVEGELLFMGAIKNTSSNFFAGLRNQINRYFDAKKETDKASELKLIRKILTNFARIANHLFDFLGTDKYQKLYEGVVDSLSMGEFIDIHKNKPFTFNINGESYTYNISQELLNIYKLSFTDLLYNFYGLQEGITTKDTILNSLISLGLNTKSFGIDTIIPLKPILEQIKFNLVSSKITYASQISQTEGSIRFMNKEVSLYTLLNPTAENILDIFDNEDLSKIVGKSLSKSIKTDSDIKIINDNMEEIKKAIYNSMKNDSAIRDRLEIAIENSGETLNDLNNFLELGLILQTKLLAESNDLLDSKNGEKSAFEKSLSADDKRILASIKERGYVALATEQNEGSINKLIENLFGLNNKGMSIEEKDELIKAIAQISLSMAETFLVSRNYGKSEIISNVNLDNGNNVKMVNKKFQQKIRENYIDTIKLFDDLIDRDEFITNDIDKVIDFVESIKNIPGKARQAFVYNLQNTGNKVGKKAFKNISKLFGMSIETLQDKYIQALENSISIKEFNQDESLLLDNFTISKDDYNTLVQQFKTMPNTEKNALFNNKDSRNNPLNYQRKFIYVYDSSGKLQSKQFEYVYMKGVTTLSNPKLIQQLFCDDNITLETIFNTSDNANINSVFATIEERQTQIGMALAMIMNARMNTEETAPAFKNVRNSLQAPVNYAKNFYYFYDLLPNGRIAMKEANNIMDNKLLREILDIALPDKLRVWRNKSFLTVNNRNKLQYNGMFIGVDGNLDIKNFKDALLSDPNKGFTADNFKSQEHKQIYLGMLYGFIRIFNVDIEKFVLDKDTQTEISNIKDKDLKELIKLFRKKEEATKRGDKPEVLAELDNKISNLMVDIDLSKLHYEYKYDENQPSINLNEMFNGLLSGDEKYYNDFIKYADMAQDSLSKESYFKEHIGMAENNYDVFKEALTKNGKFDLEHFAQNLRTQDLIVYMDGSATFMMENGARAVSLIYADAISGVFKYKGLQEDVAVKEHIFTREYIKRMAKDLHIQNARARQAYRALIENKMDIYVLAAGTTIMSLEPFRDISLLTSLFTNSSILSREYMKKLIQPAAYNGGTKAKLDKLHELVKIPTDTMITEVLTKFVENNKADLIQLNQGKLSETELIDKKTKIAEAFLNELIQYSKPANGKKATLTQELASGFSLYYTNHFSDLYNLLFTGVFDGIVNPQSKISNGSFQTFHTNLTNKFTREVNTITTYYDNFGYRPTDSKQVISALPTLNSRLLKNAIAIANIIKNKDNPEKTKFANMVFRALNKTWFDNLNMSKDKCSNEYFEITQVGKDDNKKLSITFKDKFIEQMKTTLGANNIVTPLNENQEIKELVANTLEFYYNTGRGGVGKVASEPGSFLPEHISLELFSNPLLAITKQNNKYIEQQKDYLVKQTNEMMCESMLSIVSGLLVKHNIPLENLNLEEAYLRNENFRNDFNKEKNKFIRILKNKFRNMTYLNGVYIDLFKSKPTQEQINQTSQAFIKLLEEMEQRLGTAKDTASFFKLLPTMTVETSSYNEGTKVSKIKLVSKMGIYPDIIGLFNQPLEGAILAETGRTENSPLFQIFDAIVANANTAEFFRNDIWNGGFSGNNPKYADAAYVMNKAFKNLNEAITDTMTKMNKDNSLYSTDEITNNYGNKIENYTNANRRRDYLDNIQIRMRQFIQISDVFSHNVKNIPSLFPSSLMFQSSFNIKLKEEYEELAKELYNALTYLYNNKENNPELEALWENYQKIEVFNILGKKDINFFEAYEAYNTKYKNYLKKPSFGQYLVDKYKFNFIKSSYKLFENSFDAITESPRERVLFDMIMNSVFAEEIKEKTNQNYIQSIKDSKTRRVISREVDKILNKEFSKTTLLNLLDKEFQNLNANLNDTMSIREFVDEIFLAKIKEELKNSLNSQVSDSNEKTKSINTINSITNPYELTKHTENDTVRIDDYWLEAESLRADKHRELLQNIISKLRNELSEEINQLNKEAKQQFSLGKNLFFATETTNPNSINEYNSLSVKGETFSQDSRTTVFVNTQFNDWIYNTLLDPNTTKVKDDLKQKIADFKNEIKARANKDNNTYDDVTGQTQSVEEYLNKVNEDFDTLMREESVVNGVDISEDIATLKDVLNAISSNLREGLKIQQTALHTQRQGETNITRNTITIDASADVYTRIHELWHATTYFGALSNNNRANALINKIATLQDRVKKHIDENNLAERLGLIGDKYDHIFGNQDIIANTQEFLAAFLTEPRLIAYLKSLSNEDLMLAPNGKNLEGKTIVGKGLNLVTSLIKYMAELIKHRFKAPQSALEILTQATIDLSTLNTEKGEQNLREEYEKGKLVKFNKIVVGKVADKLALSFERFLEQNPEALNEGETRQQAKARFISEVSSNRNITDTLAQLNDRVNRIKNEKNNKLRALYIAKYLLQTAFFSRRNFKKFLQSNPVKIRWVSNQLTEIRQQLIEGTIFDIKFHLDFGLKPGDFLKKHINMVNRATSARTSINFEIENAATMTEKLIKAIYTKDENIAKYLEDEADRAEYSKGLYKLIVQQNLGDFFTYDDINQSGIDDLVHYQFYATQDELTQAVKKYANDAYIKLGITEDEYTKAAISRFIVDMAYTRISGKRNKFGSQNLELLLKQLGFKEFNKEALQDLHKALTIQTIKTPKMMQFGNNEDIDYFNEQTQFFRDTYYDNMDFQDSIKESFQQIVALHKAKLDGVYKKRVIDIRKAQEYYRNKDIDIDSNIYFDSQEYLYGETDSFGRGTLDAIYDDSYQFLMYNNEIKQTAINPADYGMSRRNHPNFKRDVAMLEKLGYKLIEELDSGVLIYQYDGMVQLSPSKQRSSFMFKDLSHQGKAFFTFTQDEMTDKDYIADYRITQQDVTQHALRAYGKALSNTDILSGTPNTAEFGGLTEYKSLAGSETITRENISNKKFEEWIKPDLSIEKAFYRMEELGQEAKLRDFANNQIYYQILEGDKYIRNNRVADKNGDLHHTEVLFYMEDGKPKFNEYLKEKYGFSLTKADEKDFLRMARIMGYEIGVNKEVYIDTRLLPMLFSFDKPHLGKMGSMINENFDKENNPYVYKVLSAIQSVLRYIVKEMRANTIIRNPNLVVTNLKSNIIGLIGEGVPMEDITQALPFYIKELKRYKDDFKEKIRLENELLQITKKEFRDNTNMTAEEQLNLKKKTEKDLEKINQSLEMNKVAPLMKQGLYSNVVEDAETTGFKWDNALIDKFQEKTGTPDMIKNGLKEFFMTEDSDVYNFMAEWTRIGDFAPRAVLYYHLINKKGMTPEQALDESRERFINYNTPMWSPVMRALDSLGLVNYSKYKFNIQYQALKAFGNAPAQASLLFGLSSALEAIGIPQWMKLDNYIAESFFIDGNAPQGFINRHFSDVLTSAWRWNYVIPD